MGSPDASLLQLASELPEEECRYILYHYSDESSGGGEKDFLITYIPFLANDKVRGDQ